MLQNAYFLAKIGADTAENERNGGTSGTAARKGAAGRARADAAPVTYSGRPRDAANFTGLVLGCIETKFCK